MLPSGPREEEEDSPTSSATEGSLRGFDDMFLRHKVGAHGLLLPSCGST